MVRSQAFCLISVALPFVGFGMCADTAMAQTTYAFNGNYEVVATANDLTASLQQILSSGSSSNALYGLSKTSSLSYSQTDFTTGFYSFNTDPTAFNLKGFTSGYIIFQGSGVDRLFGTASGTGVIDFQNLSVTSSGIVNITGGEGRFTGATGTLNFSQVQPLSLEVGVALTGKYTVNGSFQTIPEPKNTTALIGLSVIGGYLLIRRRCQKKFLAFQAH